MHEPASNMGQWKNEDDIKAELRVLTDDLKHLREELRDMVAPPKAKPSRAFLHRQAWPSTANDSASRKPPPAAPVEKPKSERRKKRRKP